MLFFCLVSMTMLIGLNGCEGYYSHDFGDFFAWALGDSTTLSLAWALCYQAIPLLQ